MVPIFLYINGNIISILEEKPNHMVLMFISDDTVKLRIINCKV